MNMLKSVGLSGEEAVLILSVVVVFLCLMVLILFIQNKKLNKRYKMFMKDSSGSSLEKLFVDKLGELEYMQDMIKELEKKVNQIDNKLLLSIQKKAVVKYDAFDEMGGKFSFVLALLDANDTGYLVNSMHSGREGCYIYIKEIINGKSSIILSLEEEEALVQAKKESNNEI